MRMANGLLYDLSTLSDQVSTFIQDFPDKIIACIKLTPPDVFNCTYNNILAYNSQMGIFAPTLASKLQQVVVQSATLPLDLARCGPSVFYDRTNWFSNRLTIVQYCLDNLPITNPPA
ncbi:hypothetical protein C0J52_21576 [Blattella germanica]|nr:hypothetical protein C0J52_21576 [Blattella germanica]